MGDTVITYIHSVCAWLCGGVCHQIPERSLHIGGVPLPLCARCTGLYLSVCITAIAQATANKIKTKTTLGGRIWLIIWGIGAVLLLLPLQIDGLGNWLGFWETDASMRMMTGGAFGLGLFVIYGIVKGYDIETAHFEPYRNGTIALLAAGGITLVMETGLSRGAEAGWFTEARFLWLNTVLGVMAVTGLSVMLSCFIWLLVTRLTRKRGAVSYVLSAGTALVLLTLLGGVNEYALWAWNK